MISSKNSSKISKNIVAPKTYGPNNFVLIPPEKKIKSMNLQENLD
jgi:hypothetical protein